MLAQFGWVDDFDAGAVRQGLFAQPCAVRVAYHPGGKTFRAVVVGFVAALSPAGEIGGGTVAHHECCIDDAHVCSQGRIDDPREFCGGVDGDSRWGETFGGIECVGDGALDCYVGDSGGAETTGCVAVEVEAHHVEPLSVAHQAPRIEPAAAATVVEAN